MTVDLLTAPTPFGDLASRGTAPALVSDDGVLSYADLGDRVRARVEALGPTRRLVLLRCRNDVETVLTYLAALAGGHVALLSPEDADDHELRSVYAPDVVADGARLEDLHPGSRHDLHPDLALLLSTSGSTGSPKLVRLSHDNLRSNAASIAEYLALTADDRAVTTLPLHYCYGLSVLNSHLLVGGSVVLTEHSVLDDALWDTFRAAEATSFAGVPHTFDLLDASGFAERELPTLRYVTQAGGRLTPDRVRAMTQLGARRGFDLFVMYGQTEATARMAYLPPHLADTCPETIGVPVPGGSFRLDDGELVYAGPNVMLGYATGPADLALGRTIGELRTGDLARQREDGLWELVGRRSRFAKLLGTRIDLDRLEQRLADDGVPARAVELGGRLSVFVTRHLDVRRVHDLAARWGLPSTSLRVHVVESLPMTSSGKPDHAALARHARLLDADPATPGACTPDTVRDLYATLLGRPDATTDDSFADLGGDSLSFVEISLRLGEIVGPLPAAWPELSPYALAGLARPRRRGRLRLTPVPTTAVLRALAIVLIVGTHANLLDVMGGAHVLLGVLGFHLARFGLTDRSRSERARRLLRSARDVMLPSALWIGAVGLVTGGYDWPTALMLNSVLGSETWDDQWQLWFVEAAVWCLVGVAALAALPGFDRLERHRPYAVALAVVTATEVVRVLTVGVLAGPFERYTLPTVVSFVALGWLAARSASTRQRLLTSAIVGSATYGFFGDPVRESLVVVGYLALTWCSSLAVPRPVARVVSVLASSSLFVYLTHWQVYPWLEVEHPLLATLASFAVGILVWRCWGRTRDAIRSSSLLRRPSRSADR